MIQALKELGEQRLKNEGREVTDLVSILVQDPNQNGNYPYALVVIFTQDNGQLVYQSTEVESASKDKIKKYLYRFKAPQGADFTPTAKISDNLEKTFKNKIEKWFEKTESKSLIIDLLKNSFTNSKGAILSDIGKKFNDAKPQLERSQGCFITFGISERGKLKYLGDYPEFRKCLVESVKSDYRKIAKRDHVCSICGLKKEEVFGEAIPIPFYTIDKPGYIASGFRSEDAWKNAPVCLECSLKIEEGKRFLDEYLQFRMGGMRYYLLPKLIFGEEAAKDVISNFFQTATQREVLAQKILKRLSEDEREILEELTNLSDILTFNFLFYATPTKSVFRINLLVENILPSRIGTIFDAKTKAENHDVFKDIKMGKEYENIEFRFSNLTRRPSNDISSLVPSQKGFLEVVDKTFRCISLDKSLLYSWFMSTIRGVFAKQNYLKPWVLQAFVSLLFFKELGILPNDTQLQEGGVKMAELGTQAEEFFGTYHGIFGSPSKKALFLLGVLAQKLLNIQYQERKATPFREKLKGLRMKEDDFRGLLPKIQNKLEEYGKNYYRKLEELISDYLIQSGQSWGMSVDEMNYYFVLGMNLEDKVSQVLGKEKGEESYE